jgi:hypothetical protein
VTVIDRAEQTRWGATVGAGVEYTFAPNWSFGFDYSHLFIGTENYNFRGVGTFAGVNVRHDDIKQGADIVTARVNYRFGGAVMANTDLARPLRNREAHGNFPEPFVCGGSGLGTGNRVTAGAYF